MSVQIRRRTAVLIEVFGVYLTGAFPSDRTVARALVPNLAPESVAVVDCPHDQQGTACRIPAIAPDTDPPLRLVFYAHHPA